jgi:GNAT superfamily N-acetyltransferase
MIIRTARRDDVPEMVKVVTRSITDLCAREYRNDLEVLQRWLANKTAANFARWITDDRHFVVVADAEPGIVGVGMIASDGEIQLNYVSPDFRFKGVSKALVHAMEHHARATNLSRVYLASTQLAKRMYESAGYEAIGEFISRFGTLPGVRMQKTLDVS